MPICYECKLPISKEEPKPWYVRETKSTEWFHKACLRRFL